MVSLSTPLREPHGTLARAIEQARDANALGYFLEYLREKAEAHDQHCRADFAFSAGFLLATSPRVRQGCVRKLTEFGSEGAGLGTPPAPSVAAEVEP
jgi:hypothetical protein